MPLLFPYPPPMRLAAILLLISFFLPGCSTDGRLTLQSVAHDTTLTIDFPTRVLKGEDASTADFYLTDLPPEVWRPGADLTGVSGTIVHLHLFLPPAAGKAPMGENASNLNIRAIVVANGEIGVYAGGGFLYLEGTPSAREAGGKIANASMRLSRATTNFRDLLGPSRLSGTFEAPKGDTTVLAAKVRELIEMAKDDAREETTFRRDEETK